MSKKVPQKNRGSKKSSIGRIIFAGVAILGIYAIVPHLREFRSSIHSIVHADPGYLIAALLVSLGTYLAAAGEYVTLAGAQLAYSRTLMVQLSGMFINRLLPAGLGGIGLNVSFLRSSGISIGRSSAVVAINNGLGLLGHGLLVVGLLLYQPHTLDNTKLPHLSSVGLIICLAVVLLATAVLRGSGRLRARVSSPFREFASQLKLYGKQPQRLVRALGCSLIITLSNVGCLWVSVLSVHAHLTFVAALFVFTLGIALGTATPTPGGLGGIEAGLVAGLVVFRVDAATALAATLVFRLVTYWLPLIAGSLFFVYTRRRHYYSIS